MTAHAKPLVAFFKDIDKHDIPLVGGKGANLGEMTKAHFPVPNGFAVTVEAYDIFLTHNHLYEFVNDTVKSIDVNDPKQLDAASKIIQRRIIHSPIPKEIVTETAKAYRKLSGAFKKSLVAVRSSATAEDLPGMSFAGQQATFLNIKGEANLLNSVRECWASLFTPRAIFYRKENKIDTSKVKISVMVQNMVQSVVSGVMFTVNPVTQEKDRIIIEAVWGLGEMMVQGSVVPDKYVVQKETFVILSKDVSDQSIQLTREGAITKESKVPPKWINKQKISDELVSKLAKIGQKLQDHYYFPQDIEWAWDGKELFITQTRPITTLSTKPTETKTHKTTDGTEVQVAAMPIVTGLPSAPGIGVGHVRIITGPNELYKIKQGDILVAKMTSPDYVPAMKKASAIVTNEGGMTSHAAIVSRELGIACVVGTHNATEKLKEGTVVTVDGTTGFVFLGGNVISKDEAKKEPEKDYSNLKTATKVYINLAEPEEARKYADANVDGVGLLRAEFMMANIGMHPRQAIKEKKQEKFVEKLIDNLEIFCKSFDGKPIVYRATDFKTNEYRQLEGGKNWEPEEPNPMLGFRGAFRYVENSEVFTLELRAIKAVREKYKNLYLMIPFVRSPEELARVRKLAESEGLFEDSTFKFLMMAEIPVNVIQLEDFIKVGIDGVSIGSNDLTMLILGTDRDNSEVARAYNEMSPAVLWALERIIKICVKNGITCSICGQAPSTHPELVEDLVKWGITSVSVNPDVISKVRKIVYDAEHKLITK